MPFDLNISFSGQCLFAPEAVSGNTGRMHVLLPNPKDHKHGADRHVAVVGFDTAHLRGGDIGLDGTVAMMPLKGSTLAWGDAAASLDFKDTKILNLKDVTGEQINPKYLSGGPYPELVARVTLGAGRFGQPAEGAFWFFKEEEPRELTHRVEWKIADAGDASLTLHPLDFKGASATRPVILYPIPEGERQVIGLFVHHIPSSDLPPDPEQHHEPEIGEEAPHFRTYYRLFDPPVRGHAPRYAGIMAETATPSGASVERGGSPFNCMVVGSWP